MEVGLIFLLFALLAGSPPPDVNEAHYLAKARHVWDPSWCAGDLFLGSANAHPVFYGTFGWLTLWLPFSAAAWIGRLITWSLLAWAWRRLSWSVAAGPWLAVLSAALFVMFLRWGHMAGEWVVGGLEAKGFAYVLVLLALEALVKGSWSRVWLMLGAASAFHVLVGGWAVVAALFAWACSPDRPAVRATLPPLCGGLLLALPGLLPALAINWHVDSEVAQLANRIYVFGRLAHHLVFHEFPPVFVLRHLCLLVLVVLMVTNLDRSSRFRRLQRFVAGAVMIAALGVVVDLATLGRSDWAANLLRFYWFRLADVMVPLAGALTIVVFLRQQRERRPRATTGLAAVSIILAAASSAEVVWRNWTDPRPRAIAQAMPGGESTGRAYRRYLHWRRACLWIAENTERDALILTPRYQHSLKWYAGRAEVVNWKDVPQDAAGIVRWRQRLEEVYPPSSVWQGLVGHGESGLLELAGKYRFSHVLLDRTRSRRPLQFPRLYPAGAEKEIYELYRVPQYDDPGMNSE